ncbi:MAG TPA: hypothetical protein PKC99_00330 [Anaerolineales bacterium]|nr:hypothetical protein [Anaerolineales bacterium]
MTENYQAKRERWQRLLASLPAGLREHVSLRNVESVAALTPPAQQRLLEAIQAGLKRLPRAVEQLRINPDTTVEELLNPAVTPTAETQPEISQEVKDELAALVQLCFPDMPRVSAEALVEAEVMEAARRTAQAHHVLLQSDHLRTDFVMLVVYGLMRQSLERLEEIIKQAPAIQQAFLQSDLPWKPNEWRNRHA